LTKFYISAKLKLVLKQDMVQMKYI